jgi:hypothetical protein
MHPSFFPNLRNDLPFSKTICLIQTGTFYEKDISYYHTYRMNIIPDKTKTKTNIPHCRNSSKSNRKIVERYKGDTK